MNIPRILIAAPSSGSGKTVISCGLMAAFCRQQKNVVSCKCGPDYIDPMFHREVLGIDSQNLDLFFCEKEQLTMECTCEGMVFRSRSSSVIRPGWCGVFSRREERDGDEPEGKVGMAVFAERETLPVMGRGLVQKKTLPKPLYTEATLLGAMETCERTLPMKRRKRP